jgi:iron complex outermembrane receptor protein
MTVRFKRFSTSSYVSALAISAAMMLPVQVQAQEAAEAEAAAQEEARQDVVYVTARKRDETPLEIPISVTALSQEALDERGILSNADLSGFVPGFTFENNGVGGFAGRANPQFRFRGVGSQVNTAASRSGAFFWDGAYLSGGVGLLPLVDLGQVEVIKGPQAAFFGRNTFSGAVNYIPSEPTEEFSVRISAGISMTDGPAGDSGYNFLGVVSGPVTDKLSGRLAISQEKKGAYWEYLDGTPLGEEDTLGFIGSLKYDLNDRTTLKYSGFVVDSEDTSAYGGFASDNTSCDIVYDGELVNVVTGVSEGPFQTIVSDVTLPFPPFTPYSTFCGSIPDFDESTLRTPLSGNALPASDPRNGSVNFFGNFGNDYAGVATRPPQFGSDFVGAPDGLGNTYETFRHHFSFESELESGFTVAGFGSFGEYENFAIFDSTYGANGDTGIRYTGFAQEQKDQSFEIRLVSPQEQRMRYMIGASYYDLESILVEIRNGNYSLTSSDAPFFTSTDSSVLGIFGALDYDITEELTLSLEGRWQDDEQTIPLADAAAATSPTMNAVSGESQSYSKFMPRVILSYQPEGKNMNIYGSFSQSYLQGTQTNADGFAAAEPTSNISSATVGFFTPIQKLEAYELGFKHDLNEMFQYSAALYQMDWENQVQFVLNPQFVPYYQAGDSEYLGLELEGTLNLTDWVSVTGNYNWVDAELTRYSEGGTLAFRLLGSGFVDGDTAISAAGNIPRYIQEHSGSLSVDFDLSDFVGRNSFARIDALYTGDFYIDNLEYNKVDANTKINLRAGIALTDNAMVEIYGTNITDDLSASSSGGTTGFFSRSYFGTPVRGAEYGLRLTADW